MRGESTIMWKLIKHDFIAGGKKNIIEFIVIAAFCIFTCQLLKNKMIAASNAGKIQFTGISFGDYITYIFGGMEKYIVRKGKDFELPVIWMTMQMLLCSLVFLYPVKDLLGNGMNVLVQYGSRRKWWFSKCIWAISQVVIYYLVVFASVLLYTVFTGNISDVNMSINSSVQNLVTGAAFVTTKLNLFMVLPIIIYSFFIVMVQVTAAMIISPIVGILVVLVYDILSAYIMNRLLFANISMLLRNSLVVSNGITSIFPMLMCIAIIILLMLFSTIYFNRCHDILNSK